MNGVRAGAPLYLYAMGPSIEHIYRILNTGPSRLHRVRLLLIFYFLYPSECVEDALPCVALDALFLQPAVPSCCPLGVAGG